MCICMERRRKRTGDFSNSPLLLYRQQCTYTGKSHEVAATCHTGYTPFVGMTNYRNGPTTDHNGVVSDYDGLVLDRVAHFGNVLRHIRARRLTTMDRSEGVYRHNDIATVALGLGL